mmetsp:Transcript_29064/g.52962  ORF Transcript_29064/g.52962 Transcript_29064/m.52962 type:complete len:286 (-) Transcript_29064:111-968(-)
MRRADPEAPFRLHGGVWSQNGRHLRNVCMSFPDATMYMDEPLDVPAVDPDEHFRASHAASDASKRRVSFKRASETGSSVLRGSMEPTIDEMPTAASRVENLEPAQRLWDHTGCGSGRSEFPPTAGMSQATIAYGDPRRTSAGSRPSGGAAGPGSDRDRLSVGSDRERLSMPVQARASFLDEPLLAGRRTQPFEADDRDDAMKATPDVRNVSCQVGCNLEEDNRMYSSPIIATFDQSKEVTPERFNHNVRPRERKLFERTAGIPDFHKKRSEERQKKRNPLFCDSD